MFSRTLNFFETFGSAMQFIGRSMSAVLLAKPYLQETLRQAYRITFGTMPVVVLVSVFIGANIVVQGYQVLKMLGAETMLGMFASFALVREMAPALGGAMVGVKAGSEMASELATMKIRSQIDAIDVMGVDPLRFLVAPRVIASLIAMPILTLVVLYAAIAAGWGVAVFQFGLSGPQFLTQITGYVTGHDLLACLTKSFAFGGVMSLIQCFCGFQAEHGPQGVGLATNQAIVLGISSVAWVNLLITGLMY